MLWDEKFDEWVTGTNLKPKLRCLPGSSEKIVGNPEVCISHAYQKIRVIQSFPGNENLLSCIRRRCSVDSGRRSPHGVDGSTSWSQCLTSQWPTYQSPN